MHEYVVYVMLLISPVIPHLYSQNLKSNINLHHCQLTDVQGDVKREEEEAARWGPVLRSWGGSLPQFKLAIVQYPTEMAYLKNKGGITCKQMELTNIACLQLLAQKD